MQSLGCYAILPCVYDWERAWETYMDHGPSCLLGVAVSILDKVICPRSFAIVSSMIAYEIKFYLECIWANGDSGIRTRLGAGVGSHMDHGSIMCSWTGSWYSWLTDMSQIICHCYFDECIWYKILSWLCLGLIEILACLQGWEQAWGITWITLNRGDSGKLVEYFGTRACPTSFLLLTLQTFTIFLWVWRHSSGCQWWGSLGQWWLKAS